MIGPSCIGGLLRQPAATIGGDRREVGLCHAKILLPDLDDLRVKLNTCDGDRAIDVGVKLADRTRSKTDEQETIIRVGRLGAVRKRGASRK